MYSLCHREPEANWRDPCLPSETASKTSFQTVSLHWPQHPSSPQLSPVWYHSWKSKASYRVASTLFKTHLAHLTNLLYGFPDGSVVKNLPAKQVPGSGRCPGEGNGNPLQCSSLENPMDRGAWWATVHGVMKELGMPERLNSNKPTLMDCGRPWGSSRVSTHLLLLSLFSHRVVSDSATPWTAACQAPLSSTISQSLLKFISIESVILSNHLILCQPLLLLPSVFPSIRIFSNELVLHIGWPEYWSFNFGISPSNEYSGLIFFRIEWLISLLSKGLSRVFSSTTMQKHQFFCTQSSLWSSSHIHTWLLEEP